MEEAGQGKDNRTTTDAEWLEACRAMRAAGRKAGTNAGSWVADGNTPEGALRNMLNDMDNGDFGADVSGPFSGEWADGLRLEDVIGEQTDLDAESLTPEERDELAQEFEDYYFEAFYEEAERTVRGLLPDAD